MPAVNATRPPVPAHEIAPWMVKSVPLVMRVTAFEARSATHRCTGRAGRSYWRSSSRRSRADFSSAGTGSIVVKAIVLLSGAHAYCSTDSGDSVSGHDSPPSLRITHTWVLASWPFCFPRDETKLMCRPSGDQAG